MAGDNDNRKLLLAIALLTLAVILNVWMLIPGGSPDQEEPVSALVPGATGSTEDSAAIPNNIPNNIPNDSTQPRPIATGQSGQSSPSAQSGLDEPVPETTDKGETDQEDVRPFNRAMAHIKAGDYVPAIIILEELVAANPNDLSAISWLGVAHYQAGNDSMAVHYLEEARKLEPNDAGTIKYLSLVLYRQGELEKANKLLTENSDLYPPNSQMADFAVKVGRELSAEDGFIRESTEHFDIFYNNRDIKDIGRAALRHLDDAYRRVGSELGLYPDRPVPVLLYSDKAFKDVTAGPDWLGGIFDGKIRLPVKGLDPNDPRLRGVLMHEYTHAVVFSLTRACPSWLNEGLAEHFEGSPLNGGGQRIDLRRLEGSFLQFDAAQATVAYQMSHSAVSFLNEKYGLYRVRGILESLNRGLTFEAAFDESMPVNYSRFIEQWNDWSG